MRASELYRDPQRTEVHKNLARNYLSEKIVPVQFRVLNPVYNGLNETLALSGVWSGEESIEMTKAFERLFA